MDDRLERFAMMESSGTLGDWCDRQLRGWMLSDEFCAAMVLAQRRAESPARATAAPDPWALVPRSA